VIPRYNIKDTFAFGAKALIAYYVNSFIMKWANDVLIEGSRSQNVIGQLLRFTGLGRHTSVVLFTKFEEEAYRIEDQEVSRTTTTGTRKQKTQKVDTVMIQKKVFTGQMESTWKAKLFRWSSPSVRPHGHLLPLQCAQCKRYRSFRLKEGQGAIAESRGPARSSLNYTCRGCSNVVTFNPILGTFPAKVHSDDDWLVSDLNS
jgi:hypothetical protein